MSEFIVTRDKLTVGHKDDDGVVHHTDYKRGDKIKLEGERAESFVKGGLVAKPKDVQAEQSSTASDDVGNDTSAPAGSGAPDPNSQKDANAGKK